MRALWPHDVAELLGVTPRRAYKIMREAGKVPHALALTKDGIPRPPRGVPASARPFPLAAARGAQ